MSAFKVVLAQSKIALDVPEESTLLDVLLDAGLPVSWRCKQGYCGQCGVRVLSGTPDHYDEAMPQFQRETNTLMMACVSRCIGDELTLDL
jgi:ferredoxin